MAFEIDVEKRLGHRSIALRLATDAPIAALFGPSGAGKTSILHMVAGLLRPDRGRIAVGGALLFDSERALDLPPERRRTGYVFQESRLFPHMRVDANLRYGWRTDRRTLVDSAAVVALLGLGPLLRRWPGTLSGGETKRVAIGRALLSAPDLLLLDEPLASLERRRRAEILDAVRQLRDRLRLPILYVTHDAAEIEALDAERTDLPA